MKYKRIDLVSNNHKLIVRHWHEGNDSDGEERTEITDEELRFHKRTPARYVTEAVVLERDTGDVLVHGTAICSPKDNPCRRLGYAIAMGRCSKAYDEFVLKTVQGAAV